MKTLEQKAKAYDEKLDVARHIYADPSVKEEDKYYLEVIFPELKESEDERIRKALIEYFNEQCDMSDWNGVYGYQVIAWLEKQGEETIPLKEIILNVWELGNYWKELTKGVCNTEYGRQLDYIVKHWKEGEHYIKSFEKQGEQKSICEVKPKFKVGDWIVTPANKVLQITNIEDTSYVFNNESHYWEICYCDEQCHLWTIQDAKDGDVLATKDAVFIFKHMDKIGLSLCKSYCEVIDNSELGLGFDFSINDVYPATKEQRETLFKAMADAGYTFDFEKKELKKIEQKPAWSEEDECILNAIKHYLFTHGLRMWYDWIKSLRPQNTWKPSDEQMWALSTLANIPESASDTCKKTAQELLEQLKKLREE